MSISESEWAYLRTRVNTLETMVKQLACKHCYCRPTKYTPAAYEPMINTKECCKCAAIEAAMP